MKSKEETNKERTHIKFFLKTIITLLAFVTSATYTIIFCEFFFGKNNVYAEETMANQDEITKNQKKLATQPRTSNQENSETQEPNQENSGTQESNQETSETQRSNQENSTIQTQNQEKGNFGKKNHKNNFCFYLHNKHCSHSIIYI